MRGDKPRGERKATERRRVREKQERKDTERESVTAGWVYTYLGWTVKARMYF